MIRQPAQHPIDAATRRALETELATLTQSIAEAPEFGPPVENWLARAAEIDRQLKQKRARR
jgi:hypothetical protein